MTDLDALKTRLENVIEKTSPTTSAFWDRSINIALGAASITGGVLITYFTAGLGTPIAVGLAATGTTLIYGVGTEVEQAYTKSEWTNGGKINYINFIINGAATFFLAVLNGSVRETEGSILNIENTVAAYEDYFIDKFNGGRFLSALQLNKAITSDNLKKSWFASNYALQEMLSNKSMLTADSMEILRETIIETIGDGTFGRVFGVNARIKYMIENGFSISDIGVFIAKGGDGVKGVEDLITGLTDIQLTINESSASTLFSTYRNVNDGVTRAKIVQDYYPDQVGINLGALADPSMVVDKLNLATVLFPTEVYGTDGDGQVATNQEALDILKDFDGFGENGDITSYEFQFYDTLTPDMFPESLSRTLMNGLWNALTGDNKYTPVEVFSNQIKNKYMEFILKIIDDYQDDDKLKTSLTKTRNKVFNSNFMNLIYYVIATDKEIARRVEIFKGFEALIESEGRDASSPLTAEEIKKIEALGAKAFVNTIVQQRATLTEEQIEDRQRFYKQCALMMNIGKLNTKFEEQILARQATESFDGPMKDKPFGGRFWRAKSRNKESLMTNLVSSEDSSYMFEIPPHVMTQLTPKFRLYKVMNDQSGTLKQTEFIFPRFTDLNRDKNFKKNQGTNQEGEIPSFLAAQFDKGDGLGLKSFSINFNGTNPAEARNDIKGEMSLFFQSFADFTRKRISNNGDGYRFVDLIIQPEPDDNNMSQGIKITTLRQYEPTFYRIRVDMGYNIPKAGDIQGISSDDLISLQNALKSMNKSYYLCMIDHDFNIKNDGTVEMKFTYRAYLETALKSLRFDALTTPELAKKRIENQSKLFDIATSERCTKDELKELQLAIAGSEEELVLNSLNSIMTRMYSRSKIFNVTIDNEDRKFFLDRGYFKNCNLLNDAVTDTNGTATGDLGVVLNRNFLSENSEVNFRRDIDDTKIQFFFFGDILHTILDALNDPDTRTVAVGMENTKIVLGSFDFDPYQSNSGGVSLNISNIPISVDFFSEWFKENVLNQKSSRRTFPILNFIRSLSNYVVSNALLETCVNRNVENALLFQTGQVSVVSATNSDPLSEMIDLRTMIIDTDERRGVGGSGLPLNGDTGGSPNVEDFYHYIVLNANGSSLTYAGRGKYEDDIKKGRFHVEIGSNRGIVKTVKFSKTNMQYLREARFMRNGVDGLLQLSSVYKASVEMFGNTLFYPGMELWINPYGFGGLPLGNPQQGGDNRSLANMLGLGGYHTITSVSTTLTPTGFTTSLDSQHYYSGDGEQPDTIEPKAPKKNKTNSLIEMGRSDERDRTEEDANFCEAELVEALNFNIADANNSQSSTPSITTPSPTATPAATPAPSAATYEQLVAHYGTSSGVYQGNFGTFKSFRDSFGILNQLFFVPNGTGGTPDETRKVRITE